MIWYDLHEAKRLYLTVNFEFREDIHLKGTADLSDKGLSNEVI